MEALISAELLTKRSVLEHYKTARISRIWGHESVCWLRGDSGESVCQGNYCILHDIRPSIFLRRRQNNQTIICVSHWFSLPLSPWWKSGERNIFASRSGNRNPTKWRKCRRRNMFVPPVAHSSKATIVLVVDNHPESDATLSRKPFCSSSMFGAWVIVVCSAPCAT